TPAIVHLAIDAGAGDNALALDVPANATVTPSAGHVTTPAGLSTSYQQFASVALNSRTPASELRVLGTTDDDAFRLEPGPAAGSGMIFVGMAPPLAFNTLVANFEHLYLDGMSGSDTFDVATITGVNVFTTARIVAFGALA